jgi:predicted O-methyltransferase YrrM
MTHGGVPVVRPEYQALQDAVEGRIRLPAIDEIAKSIDNEWAIHPEVAHALAGLIVTRRCNRILEFGAGISSLVMATALAHNGGGSLTSVEQMPEWCSEIWHSSVCALPTIDATMVRASIRATVNRWGAYFRYDLPPQVLAAGAPFDLVFVDAPQGCYGRDGTLHWCHTQLADGALIVLDDANRERERRTVRRWLKIHSGLRLVMSAMETGRGLAILEYRRSAMRRLPVNDAVRSYYDLVSRTWERRILRANLKALAKGV